ncbi:hypothetical protein BDV36DRAFT_260138 [Aspergillus pseudocaelatus]|uniref:Uncharacterized protein n=1 Tax=Aspergillus pseudocaelatus TaxID=1825620 RepID=A0ABQ6WH92_9EURO|nr:hypothetical protein BDV36DRAFT_260138 [Aspergillus pseudocaelatus]
MDHLACVIAVVHGIFFAYLKGKPVDGRSAPVPRTYSRTISIISASAVGLLLRFSLGLSFTQYLWRVLRSASLKISIIEQLFSMRSSLTFVQHRVILQKVWPLILITIIIWCTSIAMSFPAMAVTPSFREHIVVDFSVPTFNAEDVRIHRLMPSSYI